MPKSVTPTRLPALDGLRGRAILLVMSLHFVGQHALDGRGSIVGKIARSGWAA